MPLSLILNTDRMCRSRVSEIPPPNLFKQIPIWHPPIPKWKVNPQHHLVSDLCSWGSSASLPLWAGWTVERLPLLWDTPPVNPPPLGCPFWSTDAVAVAWDERISSLLGPFLPFLYWERVNKGETHGLSRVVWRMDCTTRSICTFQNMKQKTPKKSHN